MGGGTRPQLASSHLARRQVWQLCRFHVVVPCAIEALELVFLFNCTLGG